MADLYRQKVTTLARALEHSETRTEGARRTTASRSSLSTWILHVVLHDRHVLHGRYSVDAWRITRFPPRISTFSWVALPDADQEAGICSTSPLSFVNAVAMPERTGPSTSIVLTPASSGASPAARIRTRDPAPCR